MNPINKQIKLETKARTNHSANENRNSAANLKSPRQNITLGSKYNAFSPCHYSAAACAFSIQLEPSKVLNKHWT
jgi:hypothetical protein